MLDISDGEALLGILLGFGLDITDAELLLGILLGLGLC